MKFFKRLTALVLVFMLIVGGVPSEIFGGLPLRAQAMDNPQKTPGTIVDDVMHGIVAGDAVPDAVTEIRLYTESDFRNAAARCMKADGFNGKKLTLINDILLTAQSGKMTVPSFDDFKGTFEGGGHIIAIPDQAYFAPYEGEYGFGPDAGLFRNLIGSASVKNLVIQLNGDLHSSEKSLTAYRENTVKSIIETTDQSAANFGTLVGRMSESSVVENCAVVSKPGVSSTLVYTNANTLGAISVGGLVGSMQSTAAIRGCYVGINLDVYSEINNTSLFAGGIVGTMAAGTPSVSNCMVYGSKMEIYIQNYLANLYYERFLNHDVEATINTCFNGSVAGVVGSVASNSPTLRNCLVDGFSSGTVYALFDPILLSNNPLPRSKNRVGNRSGALIGMGSVAVFSNLYSDYSTNGANPNGSYATGGASKASAAVLGKDWVTTRKGCPNLKWLVTPGSNVTIAKDEPKKDVTFAFSPTYVDVNANETYDSNTDALYSYEIALTAQGKMPTPGGVTIEPAATATTVTGVTITPPTPAEYFSGGTYSFSATVTGNGVEASKPPVTWAVTGGGSVNTFGQVTFPGTFTGSAQLTATCGGVSSPTSFLAVKAGKVEITTNATVAAGSQLAFGLTLTGNDTFTGTPPTWKVTNHTSTETKISNDGVLTVSDKENSTSLTVTATVKGISAIRTVTVTPAGTGTPTTQPATVDGANTGTLTLTVDSPTNNLQSFDSLVISGINTPAPGTAVAPDPNPTTPTAGTTTDKSDATSTTVYTRTVTTGITYAYTRTGIELATSDLTSQGTISRSLSANSATFTVNSTPRRTNLTGNLTLSMPYTVATTTTTQTQTYTATGTIVGGVVPLPSTSLTWTNGASSDVVSPPLSKTAKADLTVTLSKNGSDPLPVQQIGIPTPPPVSNDYKNASTASNFTFKVTPPPTTDLKYLYQFTQTTAAPTANSAWLSYPPAGFSETKDDTTKLYLWVCTDSSTDGSRAASAPIGFTVDWTATTPKSLTLSNGTLDSTGSNSERVTLKGTAPTDSSAHLSANALLTAASKGNIASGEITVKVFSDTSRYHGKDSIFLAESTTLGSMGKLTPKPVIHPLPNETINLSEGITIDIPAGAKVFYTLTPDDKITASAIPSVDEDGKIKAGDLRTKEYTTGMRIFYPLTETQFTVSAIAWSSGNRTSDVVTTVYTADRNLPKPEKPRLLLGDNRVDFSESTPYSVGTAIHFDHNALGSGKIYFSTNNPNPSIIDTNLYKPDEPTRVPDGKDSITIYAVFYETASKRSSEVAQFTIRVRKKIDGPEPFSGPATSLKPGSLIRPEEDLYLSLSSAAIMQLRQAGYQTARITYDADTDKGILPENIIGTPKPGEEYISYERNSASTFKLPDIRYLVNPPDTAVLTSDGILYEYSLRIVTTTIDADGKSTQSVSYRNALPIRLSGKSGDTIKIKSMAIYSGNEYDSSGVSNFSYIVRGPVADPVAFPTTAKDKPTVVKVGDPIALSCDSADTAIYYTVDGSRPQVTKSMTGGQVTWTPIGTTMLYVSTEPLRIQNDAQLIYTINALAVSINDTLENSAIATFRYQVEKLTAAASVTAVPLTTPSNVPSVKKGEQITLSTVTLNTAIYYTLDGTMPNCDARVAWDTAWNAATDAEKGTEPAPDGRRYYLKKDTSGAVITPNEKVYESSTKIYDAQSGIPMDGSPTKPLFSIIAVARDLTQPIKHADSAPASFTYRFAQADTPTAMPATAPDKVTILKPDTVISLSTATPSSEIYYTTNNTIPDPSKVGDPNPTTFKYVPAKGIPMPTNTETFFTIRALTRSPNYSDSAVAQFTYQPPAPVQGVYATPSPASGEPVNRYTKVTLQCSTPGAQIFYRVFSSAPASGESVTPYKDQVFNPADPIVIAKDTWVLAIAEKDGVNSKVSSLMVYEVAPDLRKPSASLGSGSVVAKGTQISLSTVSGSILHYTMDGSDPTDPKNEAVLIGKSFAVNGDYGDTMTVTAYATKPGYTPSATASFSYTVCDKKEYLTATPNPATAVSPGTTVNLTTALTNAEIYYTIDGSTPDANSIKGNSVAITGAPGTSFTIKSVAIAEGAGGAPISVFTYTLRERTAAPTASIPSGAVILEGAAATLSAAKGDIYYTTDGSDPTTSSRLYADAIPITASMVLKAIAVEKDKEPSVSVEYIYTYAGQVAAPSMSVSGGEIEQGTAIELTTTTETATIYYTTNGMDPDENSMIYTTPITIMRPVTIKAIAILKGLHNSVVNSATYTVTEPVVPKPEPDGSETIKTTQTDRLTSRRTYSDVATGPTYTDVVLTNTEYNAVLSAPSKEVVPDDTKLLLRPIETASVDQKAVNSEMGYDIVLMYDVSLERGGELIQPVGTVEIGIPIPAQYQNAIVVICSIHDDGSIEAFPTRRAGGVAYAQVNHFSKYAITVPAVGGVQRNMQTLLMIGAGAGGLLAVVSAVAVLLIRKKRKHPKEKGKAKGTV